MVAARAASGCTRKPNASNKINRSNALKDDSPSDDSLGDHGLNNHVPDEGSLNVENADCRTNSSRGIRGPILRVGIYDCIMVSFEIMIMRKETSGPTGFVLATVVSWCCAICSLAGRRFRCGYRKAEGLKIESTLCQQHMFP